MTNPQTVPWNEIPASLPGRLTLAHTDAIAVWMTDMCVYTTGIAFTIEARQRTPERILGMYGFSQPEPGHTPPMLFGMEDSAGVVSSNLPRAETGLHSTSGSYSGTHGNMRYFLQPLPPPGLLNIHFAWPYFDVAETQIEIDATVISDAIAEVVTLWPRGDDDPRFEPDRTTTPEIEIPAGGWFESVAATRQRPRPERIGFSFLGGEVSEIKNERS